MRDLTSRSNQVFGVISQYGELPKNLVNLFDRVAVFVNTDDQKIDLPSRSSFIGKQPGERPNPGHSLGNFFEWIVSNYESLPDRVAFVKSNIVPRHVVSSQVLESLLDKKTGIVMLWSDPAFSTSHFQDSRLFQNFYIERNNSWFMSASPKRRFSDFDEFMEFIFSDWARPKWIPFAPGACYVASRDYLESVPKELFIFLLEVSTYKFFPPESYAVERAMWLILSGAGTFHVRFQSSIWRSHLPEERIIDPDSKSLLSRIAEALERISCELQERVRARPNTLGG